MLGQRKAFARTVKSAVRRTHHVSVSEMIRACFIWLYPFAHGTQQSLTSNHESKRPGVSRSVPRGANWQAYMGGKLV